MDLWVWIAIFIAAWLLEALAGAAKKKQQQQQQQRAPRPPGGVASPPQARRIPPVPRPPPRTVSAPVPRFPPPPVFEVPVARPPRVRELEPTGRAEGVSAEGVSAEVDVAEAVPESTDVSHTRVTEKYRGPAPGEIGGEEQTRAQGRFVLRPRTAREAIVWMEILGRPKSERA